MISIILVDKDQAILHSVRELLGEDPDFNVLGEAGDVQQALDMVREYKPDIVILEPTIKAGNGFGTIQLISHISPRTKVVILSSDERENSVLSALKAGAKAYVLKSPKLCDLLRAIKEAINGRRYLSVPLQELAINALAKQNMLPLNDRYETLTPREREVFQLAAHGFNNTEIAERLFISRRTVENHEANLRRKLGLQTRMSQLRDYAKRRGLLEENVNEEKFGGPTSSEKDVFRKN